MEIRIKNYLKHLGLEQVNDPFEKKNKYSLSIKKKIRKSS